MSCFLVMCDFHGLDLPPDFIDSMDEKNYVMASLSKPMGIVFEENNRDVGGIFILSMSEEGAAARSESLKAGDQLVAVNGNKVVGLSFDDALGTIVKSKEEKTRLICFRGTSKQLYGPTGASQAWLDELISGRESKAKQDVEAAPSERE